MSHWKDLADRIDGKAPPGARRSTKWRGVRNEFLRGKSCIVCGGKRYLIAHHIVPFHLAPDLELVESNLLPLCEAGRFGVHCHQLIGHLGNFRRINSNVLADAAYWHQRLILDR